MATGTPMTANRVGRSVIRGIIYEHFSMTREEFLQRLGLPRGYLMNMRGREASLQDDELGSEVTITVMTGDEEAPGG